jgi:hypothetical protein
MFVYFKIIIMMKKIIILIGIVLCISACKAQIDSTLDKLENAYATGNVMQAEKLWTTLWDRQNEMSMAQVERFVTLTEKYDPEWHYDKIDDGQPDNQIDFYFAHYRNAEPKETAKINAFGSEHSHCAYWECHNCGMVVQSSSRPQLASGVCENRKQGYSPNAYHDWRRLCNVGTQKIIKCKKCGLKLQTDEPAAHINGGCCYDGRSQHQWEKIY